MENVYILLKHFSFSCIISRIDPSEWVFSPFDISFGFVHVILSTLSRLFWLYCTWKSCGNKVLLLIYVYL